MQLFILQCDDGQYSYQRSDCQFCWNPKSDLGLFAVITSQSGAHVAVATGMPNVRTAKSFFSENFHDHRVSIWVSIF